MLKRLVVVIIFLYLNSSSALAADYSELYLIKNYSQESIEKILTPFVNNKFSNIVKNNNSYILEDKKQNLYHIIILSNKNANCYLYYMSNNEDTSLIKSIRKTLKNNDIKSKKVRNSALKSFFYGEAYTILAHSNLAINMRSAQNIQAPTLPNQPLQKQEPINYDFSDEAQEKFNQQNNYTPPQNIYNPQRNQTVEDDIILPLSDNSAQNINITSRINTQNTIQEQSYNNTLTGSVVYIQDGTSFTAALLSDISSDSLRNNDRISAELDVDWIYNGQLIAPQGSILNGSAIDTKAASFAMQNGQIGLLFDEIMTPDGNIINLKTNKVYIIGNSSRALNITKRVVGGAAVGLLLSTVSIIAGVDPSKAIITGVSIGTGAGVLSTISAKGEEIKLIEGSQLKIILTEPLTVQLYRP